MINSSVRQRIGSLFKLSSLSHNQSRWLAEIQQLPAAAAMTSRRLTSSSDATCHACVCGVRNSVTTCFLDDIRRARPSVDLVRILLAAVPDWQTSWLQHVKCVNTSWRVCDLQDTHVIGVIKHSSLARLHYDGFFCRGLTFLTRKHCTPCDNYYGVSIIVSPSCCVVVINIVNNSQHQSLACAKLVMISRQLNKNRQWMMKTVKFILDCTIG